MSKELEQLKNKVTENTVDEQTVDKPKKNPPHLFQKGVSGNPSGRPKGSKNLTTKVREALSKIADGKDYTYEEALIKSILKKAILDQDQQMIKLMWNYLDGLPSQSMDITSDGDKLETGIVVLPAITNED